MSNMNKKTRDRLYPILVQRDGEYCRGCGKLPHERQLVIDHRDNNNSNNSHTNLQLLCKSCNYLKNPKGESFDLCVSNNIEEKLEESCISKNKRTEPAFREFILSQIDNVNWYSIKWDDAVNWGAEKIGISTVTAERYLKKMTSRFGPLRVLSGYEHVIIMKRV